MKFINNIEEKKYDSFVKNHNLGNMMQASKWEKIKDTWNVIRVGVEDDNNELIAAAQILERKGLWYIPRGPIMDYTDLKLVSYFLENLKIFAKKQKAKMVKLDIPKAVKDEEYSNFEKAKEDENKDELLQVFRKNGYKHKGFSKDMAATIQPRFNTVTKLDGTIPEIFPKATRRLIRDADNKFVEVERKGIDGLEDLMHALECTEKRKNIALRGQNYFKKLIEVFKENCLLYISYVDIDKALESIYKKIADLEQEITELEGKSPKKLHKLEEQKQSAQILKKTFEELQKQGLSGRNVISAAITITYGTHAEILYAGMDDKFKKLPAQYKVFSETMQQAENMGAKEVSMGGIEGDLNDSLLGFKSKFAPNIVEYYGEFDLEISKTFAFMYNYGLPLRKKILKLMKKI